MFTFYIQSCNLKLYDKVLLIEDICKPCKYRYIHTVSSILNHVRGKIYFLDDNNFGFYGVEQEALMLVNAKIFGNYYKINKLSKNNYFLTNYKLNTTK